MEINSFLKQSAFKLTLKKKEEILLPLFREEYLYHYEKNKLYKAIIDNEYRGLDLFNSLDSVPFIPVGYFKRNGSAFTSSSKANRSLLSSSTSGVPSIIDIDNETSKRQVISLTSSLSDFIGNDRREFIACDLSPKKMNSEISARHGAIIGFANFATKLNYILDDIDGRYIPDITKLKRILSENEKKPLILCGFTFLLYANLIKYCIEKKISFNFPDNSFIIHIGGWKKLQDQKVSSLDFLNETSNVLGVKPENIIDIYGFTEQMGTIYPECQYGYKHVPDHAHIISRDPYSHKKLTVGEIGVGQFLSLVPRSYAGFSLITDDLVQVHGSDDCRCGRKGTYFKIIGRAKSAEIRGCGDVIAEKIIKKNNKNLNKKNAILHYNKSKLVGNKIINWNSITNDLKIAGHNLETYSVDDIILIFRTAANKWISDKKLKEYRYNGLEFISNWILSGGFENNLDLSLRGSRHHLDDFVFHAEYNKKLIAYPRGIVTHWLAGNVPILGIISLLLSISCKNTNIVKISQNSLNVLTRMLDLISEINVKNHSGKYVNGKVITDAVNLVYVDRDSEENKKLSALSNVRVAWGGKDAVTTIVNFPKKFDSEDLVFGPKLSLNVIGKESLQNHSRINRIARSIAIDCSVFNQKACASSHNVFIEKNDDFSTKLFLEFLEKKMDEIAEKIPNTELDFNDFDNIKNARLDAYMSKNIKKIITSKNMKWTIFFDQQLKLNEPTFGRTLNVHEINNASDVASLLSSNNQVVGLDVRSFRRDELSKLYLKKGVSRITPIGGMTNFELPWDDVFPTEKLIRWCYAI